MTDDLVTRAENAKLRLSAADPQHDPKEATEAEIAAAQVIGDMAARIEQDAATIARLDGEREANNDLAEDWRKAAMRHLGSAKTAEAKVAALVEALQSVLDACDQGRMIPRPGCGVGGMTIDANIRGSVYTGVPAWPIEEARAAIAAAKEGK